MTLGRYVSWRPAVRGGFVGKGQSGMVYGISASSMKIGRKRIPVWNLFDASDKLLGRFETSGYALDGAERIEHRLTKKRKSRAA